MKIKILYLITILLGTFFACDPEPDLKDCSDNPTENVGWLKELIKKENDSTYNDSINSNGLEIIQYYYKDQTVFYIRDCIKNCNDALDIVYDCEKNVLCEFGGIAGVNTCPDFEEKAISKKILFTSAIDTTKSCDKETIIDAKIFKLTKASPINKVSITENCLNITFNMLITQDSIQDVYLVDSGQILESNPPQRKLKFKVKDNFTKPISILATTSFDISDLATWDKPKVFLRIDGVEEPILYIRKPQCGDPNINCVFGNSATQKMDNEKLDRLYAEIIRLSKSRICKNPKEWDFIGVGSKACGGPAEYIAYSTKIDTICFLAKVKEHQIAEKKYNIKWGIYSDCAIVKAPTGITCSSGNVELIYGI